MAERRKISFGPDYPEYKWDHKKTPLDNWKEMKEYYAKKGRDIGDFPVMTDEEKANLTEQLKNIK